MVYISKTNFSPFANSSVINENYNNIIENINQTNFAKKTFRKNKRAEVSPVATKHTGIKLVFH